MLPVDIFVCACYGHIIVTREERIAELNDQVRALKDELDEILSDTSPQIPAGELMLLQAKQQRLMIDILGLLEGSLYVVGERVHKPARASPRRNVATTPPGNIAKDPKGMNEKFNLGQISIYRSELFKRLSELAPDKLDQLQEEISGTIGDLKSSWGDSLSPLQSGVIDALEVIEFRIRNRKKFRHGTDTGRDHPYFICRNCDTPILIKDLASAICPTCKTARWLELVYV